MAKTGLVKEGQRPSKRRQKTIQESMAKTELGKDGQRPSKRRQTTIQESVPKTRLLVPEGEDRHDATQRGKLFLLLNQVSKA